mgnify:CR=1 FL=1
MKGSSQVYGPYLWPFTHFAADCMVDNPDYETRKGFSDFFNSLKYVLPRGLCRDNYRDMLSRYPVTPESFLNRRSAISIVNDLHNDVNSRLGKPVYTLDESMARIQQMWNPPDYMLYFLMFIFVIVAMLFMVRAMRSRSCAVAA